MTLETLYRDVNARLSTYNEYTERIYSQDVIKALNDAIAEVRTEATQNRVATQIATTEVIDDFVPSTTYPYLLQANLTSPLLNTANPMVAILQAEHWFTATELENASSSATAGDRAYINGKLYSCVTTYITTNTFSKTFDPKRIKSFYANNGAYFSIGDIIVQSGVYWKVLEAFTNDSTQTFAEGARFTQVYWASLGYGSGPASVYPISRITEMKLLGDTSCNAPRGIAVSQDVIYATPNLPKLTITYVPEWTYVADLDATIDVPTEWASQIKMKAIQKIMPQLGIKEDN